MDLKDTKEYFISLQRLSISAMFILDNPNVDEAYAICINDAEGKENFYYGMYPSKSDVDTTVQSLLDEEETCKHTGAVPMTANGFEVKTIPNIKKYKASLVKTVAEKMSKLENDNSELTLHLLASLVSGGMKNE